MCGVFKDPKVIIIRIMIVLEASLCVELFTVNIFSAFVYLMVACLLYPPPLLILI